MKRAVLTLALVVDISGATAGPRVPWTTSQIAGTPEPPKLFVSEHAFPALQFTEIVEMIPVPGTERLLVVERRGKISTFVARNGVESADEVMDLLPSHPNLNNAFGIVLHPQFRTNRQIFVCYALRDGSDDGTKVSRFTLTSLDPLRADPASEEVVLTWLAGGHNGGCLQFGPDGYLYISTGDSGPAAPPDPRNTGQDPSDLSGSILRIDVDRLDPGKKYAVPSDNPWASGTATAAGASVAVRPEIWAFGLRNPWKISFDRPTGNLWCGDVGWERWEMVYLITRGGNYGWSAWEASQPIKPQLASPLAPITKPVVVHPHSEAASITGGFVYHGKNYPELAGAYVYGDWVTGKIWALWYDGAQITRHEEIAQTPHAIITFGEDDAGELYYAHYSGRESIHRLVRNPQAVQTARFPQTLSVTGVFADVARQQPAAGVQAFTISGPMWQDGATASRLIALRDLTGIATTVSTQRSEQSFNIKADYTTTWPAGAVLARTIALGGLATSPSERTKPIETQLLHYDGKDWRAYSYRWNDAGTDADLVPDAGAEATLHVAADPQAEGARTREYVWRFHARAECLRCHNARVNGALAFTPGQLRGAGARQMTELIDQGFVDGDFFEQVHGAIDATAGETRTARAYLHVNCAHCHTAHAGGSVAVFLSHELLTAQLNVVDADPMQGGLGLKQPKLIAPGDPWNSVLAVRMAKTGAGHMPLIGAHEVDVAGLKTIEDWIARLPSNSAVPKPWAERRWDQATIERELATVDGAMRVRRAIDDGKVDVTLRAAAFRVAWASPEATVRDIFERFKPEEMRQRTLGATVDVADVLQLDGDSGRGEKLVGAEGRLASCRACHLLQGQGRHFGPDLSRIGARQNAAQLLESIVAPSKFVAPEFRSTTLELHDGTSHVGFVRARGREEFVLASPDGGTLKVKRADVVSEKRLLTSLMPEGLLQGITPQDAADLVAYLASLK